MVGHSTDHEARMRDAKAAADALDRKRQEAKAREQFELLLDMLGITDKDAREKALKDGIPMTGEAAHAAMTDPRFKDGTNSAEAEAYFKKNAAAVANIGFDPVKHTLDVGAGPGGKADPNLPTLVVFVGADAPEGVIGAVGSATKALLTATREAAAAGKLKHNVRFVDTTNMSNEELIAARNKAATDVYGSIDAARGKMHAHWLAHGEKDGSSLMGFVRNERGKWVAQNRTGADMLAVLRDDSDKPLYASVDILACNNAGAFSLGGEGLGRKQVLLGHSRMGKTTDIIQLDAAVKKALAETGSVLGVNLVAADMELRGEDVNLRAFKIGDKVVDLGTESGRALATKLRAEVAKVTGSEVAGIGILPVDPALADAARIFQERRDQPVDSRTAHPSGLPPEIIAQAQAAAGAVVKR